MSLPKISDLGPQCCGCAACASTCPVSAISIDLDSYGFPLSRVDEACCIGCGKCDAVCLCLTEKRGLNPLKTFAVQSAEGNALEASSSGGVFNLLASHFLAAGGAVYGAGFDDDFKEVRHKRVSSFEDLDSIMRSKYVQSYIEEDIYQAIGNDLLEGRCVLFAGTQCQAAAVKLRFQRCEGSERLLTVDVICHGVPSPELWRRYLLHLEDQARSKVVDANFRLKEPSWRTFSIFVGFENEDIYQKTFSDDWFMKTFLNNASLRDSCFNCPGKGLGISDITLGDFWGIEKTPHESHFDSSLGVSAVLLHSEKGISAFEGILQNVNAVSCSLESIVAGNSPLICSVRPYGKRQEFMDAVASGASIESLQKRWGFRKPMIARLKARLKKMKRAFHFD